MSMNIDIEINFAQDYSPKKILELLLKNIDGRLDLDGFISYVLPEDKDNFDWITVPIVQFNINDFFQLHGINDKICINFYFNDCLTGGIILIYSNYFCIMPTNNTIFINNPENKNKRLVNFSWYLKNLEAVTSLLNIESIKCTQFY